MLLKIKLICQFQRSIYGLFILWLGLLAPLVYFDSFAANHHVQPYRLALFERHKQVTSPLPATLASQLRQQFAQRLTRQQDVISTHSPLPGLVQSLQWSLGQLYLVTGMAGLLLLLFGCLHPVEPLSVASTELSPPEKPPRRA